MAEENKPKEAPRTATQRLQDLETGMAHIYQTLDYVARDLKFLKDATKLLHNKVDAIVQATAAKEEISDAVLDRIMVEKNVEDLKNKVTSMVVSGILLKEDQVSENSFIVGSESDETGKVVNPRIQFALKVVTDAAIQAKLLGAKIGDVIIFKEGANPFTILESYKIQDPAQTAPAETPTAADAAAATTAATEAAPVAEATPAS